VALPTQFSGGVSVHQAWSRLMRILTVATTDALRRQYAARARMKRAVR
jgi:hypothetical protein